VIGEKAKTLGIKEADAIVVGVGSGREPTIRAFMAHGMEITGIKDATPVPHNGPKKKKPRRV
jgi:small subunit ribosomal protein S11